MIELRIAHAGDAALLVELPPVIAAETSARVIAHGNAVRERCGAMIRDVVVGYCSLTVYFDPLALDHAWLEAEIRRTAEELPAAVAVDGPLLDVPVCYGGDLGPDLRDVATLTGCTEEEVVAIHSGTTYRVYVVGFVPGFAYMAPLDPRISLPRRATPRTRVPAGSVAIAAGQTGIYPSETPGGWHLIGRTRIAPYDAARRAPFLFAPGDRVRFRAIDRSEFDRTA